MRAFIVAILLCLCATRALAYSAISVGEVLGGKFVWAYRTNLSTVRAAIETSKYACNSIPAPAFVRPCYSFSVMSQGCFALYTTANAGYVTAGEGASEDEASSNAKAICDDARPNQCVKAFSACETASDPRYAGEFAYLNKSIDDALADIKSSVTALTLIAGACILALAAGFTYALLKIRQLHRSLADEKVLSVSRASRVGAHEPRSRPESSANNAVDFTVLPTGEAVASKPVGTAPDRGAHAQKEEHRDGLDTSAIKEAYKSRRQEFDI
jgi:hypothetical protein